MTLIRYPTNEYQYYNHVFWTGHLSNVVREGAIMKWLIQFLKEHPDIGNKILLFIPCSDGDITKSSLENVIEIATSNKWTLIVGTVAQRFQDFNKFLFLPQDDGIFDKDLVSFFPDSSMIPWDRRIDKVFWRGACSADYKKGELLRRDVVANLIDYPYADVKLIELWHEDKPIPSHYFAPKVQITKFLNYKYILIIDGNGISSSHTWVFASGAVPIMITNNEFWFKKYLEPYKHYIPIEYNLSDLKEKLDWLRSHDSEAKQIAENARQFAKEVFSSAFQKAHLEKELYRLASE